MDKAKNESQSEASTPSIELLQKLELVIETALRLVPRIILACVHYAFRPSTFLHNVLSSATPYRAPPYTFLAFTSLVFTFSAIIAFSFFESVVDGFIDAVSAWVTGPGTNRGDERLAHLLQTIRDRSFTSTLLSTGAIVVALAGLARTFSRLIAEPASAGKLERLCCYVAGGQQIHTVLISPALVILALLVVFSKNMLTVLGLMLAATWCLILPALAISRALYRLQHPTRKWITRFSWGLLYSVLNLTTASLAVYGIEAVPATLSEWQTRLSPPPSDRPVEVLRYSRASLDAQRQLTLSLAIEVTSGRALIIDKDRLAIGSHALFMESWRQAVEMIDSSDGQVPLMTIQQGETKWITLRFSLTDALAERILRDGQLSTELYCGLDSIHVHDVPVLGLDLSEDGKPPNQL